jgi:DNA polymerase-3 subunit beta
MKIIFNKQKIIAAVAPLMCAVSNKATFAACEGILIEAKMPDTCVLTTYDTEKGMRTTINATVIEEGCYIINAQKFNQTIKVMDGEEVTLSVNDKMIATFESGRSNHRMNATAGDTFPAIPRLTSDYSFVISQGVLKQMMNKVSFAMAINDQRPVLNGAFFDVKEDSLRLVSCDGSKLAKCTKKTEVINTGAEGSKVDFSFILPVKTVNELTRMLLDDEDESVQVFMTRKNIVFILGSLTFFSRLVDGRYVDYDRLLIKNHKMNIEVDRHQMLSALERASLITEERIASVVRAAVHLDLGEGLLKILAKSPSGSTYDEIEVDHEGDGLLIAFCNRYLMDTLRACGTDRVKISLSSPLIAINIVPAVPEDDVEEEYMLLPLKINPATEASNNNYNY